MWIRISQPEKNVDLSINMDLVRTISIDQMMGAISFVFGDAPKGGGPVLSMKTVTIDDIGKDKFDELKKMVDGLSGK